MYLYHGVSSKFLDYYLALFYWIEKNKHKPYLEQAYDIITLLSNQAIARYYNTIFLLVKTFLKSF